MAMKAQAPATAKAPSTPIDQRDNLTSAQVCDLPMDELLARVNGSLDSTGINEPGFFGYVTVTASGRITIYSPTCLGDDTRDAAIRFLITQHLGLSAHLFPDVFQVTRFEIPGEVQA
ncbi:hypothetical protein OHB41_25990 [Streptomyces sp. NBC_01571]|uniref:hypothetical protein n=1 Tax=Streptomyces sp. NBC_01571 TaxID=2975883 RepID=UPI0022528D0A|nr:hypothetical protein [Streptomyces sp. NBC_01571]MCX4576563.1 hypothetical protein [Streptomyces sp. NBC_01571]